MRRIFRSNRINDEFLARGFIRMPLLDAAEVAELADFFREKHAGLGAHDFYSTIWLDDPDMRKQANQRITAIILKKISTQLEDYVPVFANYMVKKPSAKSVTEYHQDWTFVDESRYRSINIWIPLAPLTDRNGPLEVVPYSTHYGDKIRGRNIPSPFRNAFKWIARFHGVRLYPKPGEAIIFDNALIHGSKPNLSDEARVAVSLVMRPAEAQGLHYSCDDEGRRTVYERHIDDDFYIDFGFFSDITNIEYTNSFERSTKKWSYLRFLIDHRRIKRRFSHAGI